MLWLCHVVVVGWCHACAWQAVVLLVVCLCVVVDLWACCECGVGSSFLGRRHVSTVASADTSWLVGLWCWAACMARHTVASALHLPLCGGKACGKAASHAFLCVIPCCRGSSSSGLQALADAGQSHTGVRVCAAVHHPGCVDCRPVWGVPCSCCCSGGALWLLCRHAVCGSCTISSCVADWATICVSRVVLALYITAVRIGALLAPSLPSHRDVVTLRLLWSGGCVVHWCVTARTHMRLTHVPHTSAGVMRVLLFADSHQVGAPHSFAAVSAPGYTCLAVGVLLDPSQTNGLWLQ
jgi:hypothetical protein